MAQGVEQVRARITAARGGAEPAEQRVEYLWRGEEEHQESKTGGTNVGHKCKDTDGVKWARGTCHAVVIDREAHGGAVSGAGCGTARTCTTRHA